VILSPFKSIRDAFASARAPQKIDRPSANEYPACLFLLEVRGMETQMMSFFTALLLQALSLALLLMLPLMFPAKIAPVRKYLLSVVASSHETYFPVRTQKFRPVAEQVVRKQLLRVETVQMPPVYRITAPSPRYDTAKRDPTANLPDPPIDLKAPAVSPALPDVSFIPVLKKPRELVAVGFDSAQASETSSGPRALLNTAAFSTASNTGGAQQQRELAETTFDAVPGLSPPKRSVVFAETPTIVPVEILQEPKPAYTKDARDNKVEGDVILQVLFSASGVVEVQRVIKGLGYGLESSAEAAAQEIRFRPARRDGVPVDSTAVVHVKFRLAY
jgi:TonB family protein